MDAEEALLRITLLALEDPEFRQAWEQVVREGADAAAAQITGARMAGRTEGYVDWDCTIPCPAEMDLDSAALAYRRAVANMVSDRLDAMLGKPAGGLG